MTDLSGERPDPAVREKAVAVLHRMFGHVPEWDEQRCLLAVGYLNQAGLLVSKLSTPPLPEEPPNGAVCRGSGNDGRDVWQRDDQEDVSVWWLTGSAEGNSYKHALNKGLQPTRRLVDMPDRDWLAGFLRGASDELTIEQCDEAAEIAIRALSEKGAPDAD